MTVHLVELWAPTPKWDAMSAEERGVFFGDVVSTMETEGPDANCLGWGITDHSVDSATAHRYVAVWEFDNDQDQRKFLATLRETGWYEHFDQVNVSAVLGAPEATAGHMIAGDTK